MAVMRKKSATLRVLATAGGLRRTLIAYTLYCIIEFAIWVAIILYAFAEGGATLAGIVAVVQLLPAALIGPALASFGDRMNRGTALVLAQAGVAVTTALTTAALLVNAPVPVVIGTSMLATIAISVVRPLHFAVLPQLARGPQELVSSNALSSSAEGIAMFLGPILAGLGAAAAGPWLVFTAASMAAIAATALCVRLPVGPPVVSGDAADEGWRAAIQGLVVLWREWGAVALLLIMATRFLLLGALDVLGVAYSEDVLFMGETGAGLIIGAVGIGGLIGGLIAGSASMRARLAPVVGISGVVQGLAFAAVAFVLALGPAMILLAVSGAAAAVMMVAGRTLLQRTSDSSVLARVFAVQEGVALLGTSMGAALAPALVAWASPASAFVPLGVGVALLTAAVYLLLRRLDSRAVVLTREVSLLGSVDFLRLLPAYEREQLAQAAVWVDVPAGTAVVTQGEPGDRFYVIEAGEFTVAIDGEPLPLRLGPGDSFGETALLWSVPRTATVAAVTEGRLLALEAQDFLAAVTGSPDGEALAHEVSRGFLRQEP
jgi:MFS family permease